MAGGVLAVGSTDDCGVSMYRFTDGLYRYETFLSDTHHAGRKAICLGHSVSLSGDGARIAVTGTFSTAGFYYPQISGLLAFEHESDTEWKKIFLAGGTVY
ncbi:hypothetical protein KIPB_004305 [Kipferlia bialata]|uniref:Uncharacterized protein n=1 Tax=Kipferlia bialata TaxID=797122 RepID=A0A9K3CUB0_9EUKA|nr:hypothetical protein KIPB_004305 [Kipferlia bialata]|eukprot:g4305.t1